MAKTAILVSREFIKRAGRLKNKRVRRHLRRKKGAEYIKVRQQLPTRFIARRRELR